MTGPRRGTTLLGVLVAVALCAALLAALFVFLGDLLETRDRAWRSADRLDAIGLLMEKLETDLALAVAGDASVGSGILGDAEGLVILTRSIQLDAQRPRLGLVDLRRHEYRHDPATRTLSVRRGEARRGDRESAAIGAPLALVRFRYHDGAAWCDGFDSRRDGGLPAAVEVSVWIELPRPEGAEQAPGTEADPLAPGLPGAFDMPDADAQRAAEADPASLPPPDRRRVIAVLDGGVPEGAAP